MIQTIVKIILNAFGNLYIWIEKYMEYPDDNKILGMDIDKKFQTMSRKNLCRYMDAVLPEKGFFDIQSTSKIRLGCQLLHNYNKLKKAKIQVPTNRWRRGDIMEWLDRHDIGYDKTDDTKQQLLQIVHMSTGVSK